MPTSRHFLLPLSGHESCLFDPSGGPITNNCCPTPVSSARTNPMRAHYRSSKTCVQFPWATARETRNCVPPQVVRLGDSHRSAYSAREDWRPSRMNVAQKGARQPHCDSQHTARSARDADESTANRCSDLPVRRAWEKRQGVPRVPGSMAFRRVKSVRFYASSLQSGETLARVGEAQRRSLRFVSILIRDVAGPIT